MRGYDELEAIITTTESVLYDHMLRNGMGCAPMEANLMATKVINELCAEGYL